jgi:hypothetical protein
MGFWESSGTEKGIGGRTNNNGTGALNGRFFDHSCTSTSTWTATLHFTVSLHYFVQRGVFIGFPRYHDRIFDISFDQHGVFLLPIDLCINTTYLGGFLLHVA